MLHPVAPATYNSFQLGLGHYMRILGDRIQVSDRLFLSNFKGGLGKGEVVEGKKGKHLTIFSFNPHGALQI